MSLQDRVNTSSAGLPPQSEVERSTARYLFAIFRLSTETENRITTGELQEYLGVTPASVTEMITKLDEHDYVHYEKYQGVKLTTQGEAIAGRVTWRFCIVSSFFDSTLDTTLDEQTAFEIGFLLPTEGVFRLRELVSTPCPEFCPESGQDTECCPA